MIDSSLERKVKEWAGDLDEKLGKVDKDACRRCCRNEWTPGGGKREKQMITRRDS